MRPSIVIYIIRLLQSNTNYGNFCGEKNLVEPREKLVKIEVKFKTECQYTSEIIASITAKIITAIERKSRFLLIINNPDGKNATNIVTKLKEKIMPFKPKSITLDNGLEFAKHLELNTKTFFCDPYSPWQKGSVENANGLIRKFLPKSYKGNITDKMLENIQNIINNKPRKILGWKSPQEIFNRCTSN